MHSTENAPAIGEGPKEKTVAKHTCAYCGNNPVPHFINWYFESLNVLLTPVRQLVIKNPLSKWLRHASHAMNLDWQIVRFFRAVKVLSEQPDRTKCKVSRAQVLWEEAEKRGIEMKELLLFGKPFDTYVAQKSEILNSTFETKSKIKNHKSLPHRQASNIVFSGLPRPFNDEPAILDVMDDKAILKKLFTEHNLPVPKGGSAITFRKARKIFRSIGKPAIVKPRVGSRGRHSTTFIFDERELRKAFRAAKQLCLWAIVEEQLEGPVYRATCINYELCGVLRGDSPQVAGDGIHTIRELIEMKNNQPHPGVKDIVIDEKMEVFLKREFSIYNFQFSDVWDFVLPEGLNINLTEKIGVNYGGSSSEDLSICHHDNRELFELAARVLGDPVVGFDFIIPDITKSWKEQRCGFLEANSLPFINLHHDPLSGKPENVAAKVWDMMEMKNAE